MIRTQFVLAGSLAIASVLIGCSKEKEAATPAQGAVGAEQSSTFRFVPQDRSFTQKTTDSKTVSSPGTSFSSEMQGQYTWDITAKRASNNAATYSAQLRNVLIRFNDQNAVNETPAPNEVKVQVDGTGQVLSVTGAETIGQGLVAKLPPEQREGARIIIDDAAKTAVAERFQLTVSDLQGRPTALGSTWTVSAPQAGGPVRSKTWKVQGKEMCGTMQCLRVESTYDIDSEAIASQLRGDLVGLKADESGQMQAVTLSDVSVNAHDSILVEPNTLFLHKARFEQTARVILEKEGTRKPMLITEVRELETSPR
jgi:hypothetical protein